MEVLNSAFENGQGTAEGQLLLLHLL